MWWNNCKFKINSDKFNISAICKNGHKFNDLTFDQFKSDCIKETNYLYLNCRRCYSKINDEEDNNFICEVCQHVFCNNTLFFSN